MKIKKIRILILSLIVALVCACSGNSKKGTLKDGGNRFQLPYKIDSVLTKEYTKAHYTKHEYHIKMRDGVKLYTVVYSPKDTSETYPILMKRTPYSCRPYEKSVYPRVLSRNPYLVKDGYIFVCQDVRGRWMSKGDYTNMTPNKKDPSIPDESSDTYDTIEWLLKNIPNNNGKVGMYGISYPGFYTSAALPDAHPALVASSPQAPIADFFFDDFHHNGAFTLSYWPAVSWFGFQSKPTTKRWYDIPNIPTADKYYFYLYQAEPLSKTTKNYFSSNNYFWNNIINHPNYDEFWQKRNIRPALRGIDNGVLVVGGWFDAQDLFGALATYKTIEKYNPEAKNIIVMGPWRHGAWSGFAKHQKVGDFYYGDDIDHFYKKNIEAPFFRHYLKGKGDLNLPEAYMFDTGTHKWNKFSQWPPKAAKQKSFYLHDDGSLNMQKPTAEEKDYTKYISDPHHPVPVSPGNKRYGFIPPYQTSDQRFAARRPDVITFTTDVLDQPVKISGPITAHLFVSTSGTASDWIVKVIDVFPLKVKEGKYIPKNVMLDNYHELVRGGVMRGRFRDSFSNPKPFVPGKVTNVSFVLKDINHTFKKGHRIQLQIQSTWFPLIDINPQTYVQNIYKADSTAFQKAMQRVYHTPKYPTSIEFDVVPQGSLN